MFFNIRTFHIFFPLKTVFIIRVISVPLFFTEILSGLKKILGQILSGDTQQWSAPLLFRYTGEGGSR